MRGPIRLIALLAASLAAASLAACAVGPADTAGPQRNERLGDVLSLDADGRGRLRGTVRSWGESSGPGWSGRLTVAMPVYLEGEPADVVVAARVDTMTVVGDGSGAHGEAALRSMIGRLLEDGGIVDVAVHKEGGVLRADRVGTVGAIGRQPPALEGVLGLDAAGRGSYRGWVARVVSSVSTGELWIEKAYRARGIDVSVSVPLNWDSRTSYTPLVGAQSPLAAVMRSGPEPLSRRPLEVGFRRAPDGLVIESVAER